MDPNAPHPSQVPPAEYAQGLPGVPGVAAGAPAVRDIRAERHDGVARGSAVGIALLIHVLIFALLALIVFQTLNEDVPELVVESGAVEAPVKLNPKTFNRATKPEPSAPSMTKAMVVTTTAPSMVTVPAVEDVEEFEIGMGDAFGAERIARRVA